MTTYPHILTNGAPVTDGEIDMSAGEKVSLEDDAQTIVVWKFIQETFRAQVLNPETVIKSLTVTKPLPRNVLEQLRPTVERLTIWGDSLGDIGDNPWEHVTYLELHHPEPTMVKRPITPNLRELVLDCQLSKIPPSVEVLTIYGCGDTIRIEGEQLKYVKVLGGNNGAVEFGKCPNLECAFVQSPQKIINASGSPLPISFTGSPSVEGELKKQGESEEEEDYYYHYYDSNDEDDGGGVFLEDKYKKFLTLYV